MKVIGYVLVLLGLLFAAASKVTEIQSVFISSLKLSKAFLVSYALIIGVVFLLFGAFLILKSGKIKQPEEVPIYEGKKIVGYRRA